MTTNSHTPDSKDALPAGALRGRGAGLNPANRFESLRLHVLGDHYDRLAADGELHRNVRTQILEDHSRTIINKVDSPDLGFHWTVNPYRGCEHGCMYCYARPGHEYLGMSSGLDFETRILAKLRAPELLRRELASPKWKGEGIVMSGVTDPYQPVERRLRLTRRCIQVFAEFRQAVSFITKSKLILRDLDVLKPLIDLGAVRAAISLTTLDNELASRLEPRASSPRDRLDAIRALTDAGIPVIVMTAPIIPAINDAEIPRLLQAAADAGAVGAGYILLRLPYQIKDIFLDWLIRHFPDRAAKVESLLRQSRDGNLYDARAFHRMRGRGHFADQIERTFQVFSKRYGLNRPLPPTNTRAFRRPVSDTRVRSRRSDDHTQLLFPTSEPDELF